MINVPLMVEIKVEGSQQMKLQCPGVREGEGEGTDTNTHMGPTTRTKCFLLLQSQTPFYSIYTEFSLRTTLFDSYGYIGPTVNK